jgi:hypothetical protein
VKSLQDLLNEREEEGIASDSLPPVDKWNPPLSGDMDLRISSDGTWYHEGTEFQRQALVKLFASILKREGDEYFLVTPVEKWRIQVDDVPLLVTSCEISTLEGEQVISFTTATDDHFLLSEQHPLRVEVNSDTGEPSPYVRVRRNLDAKLTRSVYYELVSHAIEQQRDGKTCYIIKSLGEEFILG